MAALQLYVNLAKPSLIANPMIETSIPPGIDPALSLQYYASGGNENSKWAPYTQIKHYTNAFIACEGKVLLGYKKRGFGEGKYNGFGGKVEPGETPLQAAGRELQEESGVTATLEHAGSLFFLTTGTEWAFQIDIYRADSYEGTITESDEMRPEWFASGVDNPSRVGDSDSSGLPPIPFDKMWETDEIWIPLLLSKKPFAGRADFIKDGEVFKPWKWWYGTVVEGPKEE